MIVDILIVGADEASKLIRFWEFLAIFIYKEVKFRGEIGVICCQKKPWPALFGARLHARKP